MKRIITIPLLLSLCVSAIGDDLRISVKEPVIVTAPAQWKSEKDKTEVAAFPYETYRVTPPAGRNAVCLVSIYEKNKALFADADFLKKLVRGDSRPYVNSPAELPKLDVKELKLKDGLGFYVNFVDPDLVGKPVQAGSYKTATPVILSLGTNYLVKATILCDEIGGTDYKDAIKILESIRIKKD